MQMDDLLSNAKALKNVVEVADDTTGALAAVDTLIDKVIHLLWKPFTANAKDRTLPSCHEVHRPWLSCIAWIMHLLGEVKGVVHRKVL